MKVTDLLEKSCGEMLSDVPAGLYLVSSTREGGNPWLVLWDPGSGPTCAFLEVEDGVVCTGRAEAKYVIRRITEISFK